MLGFEELWVVISKFTRAVLRLWQWTIWRSKTWVVGKKRERKKKIEREKKWYVGSGGKKKKKREGREIQRQQRECGRKIVKEGILGVVKYKRK